MPWFVGMQPAQPAQPAEAPDQSAEAPDQWSSGVADAAWPPTPPWRLKPEPPMLPLERLPEPMTVPLPLRPPHDTWDDPEAWAAAAENKKETHTFE